MDCERDLPAAAGLGAHRRDHAAAERLLDSLSSGDGGTHTITVVLKNHLESIGDTPLVLDDEDFTLLLLAFRHDFRPAIFMPMIYMLILKIL